MPLINGRLIRSRRRQLDRSTAEQAERVGVAEGTLRNIEAEIKPASERLIYRLARDLRVPAEEIRARETKSGAAA